MPEFLKIRVIEGPNRGFLYLESPLPPAPGVREYRVFFRYIAIPEFFQLKCCGVEEPHRSRELLGRTNFAAIKKRYSDIKE
jgi:hypothetical protein